MKSLKNVSDKKSIDLLRHELYDIIEKGDINDDKVQKISCELDKLILLYQKKQNRLKTEKI
jgi:hypothetical protein